MDLRDIIDKDLLARAKKKNAVAFFAMAIQFMRHHRLGAALASFRFAHNFGYGPKAKKYAEILNDNSNLIMVKREVILNAETIGC